MTNPRGLTLRGTAVRFELADGSEIAAPAKDGLFYDDSGRDWPARSLLVGPFKRGGPADQDEVPKRTREYLGRTYTIRQGEAKTEIVPRALWHWEKLGEVARIYYRRGGTKAPGSYQHPFNKRYAMAVLMKGKGKVTLYRWGKWRRLEMPRGAILDNRGIVWP